MDAEARMRKEIEELRQISQASACLVSVVIPTRNRRDLLLRAIESVRHQTHPRWEIVVVDDRSTDGTAEAVLALADARIRLIVNRERCGAGFSRNYGAALSHGDYVAFLDSDDYWLPDKLRVQILSALRSRQRNVVVICPPASDDGMAVHPTTQPPLRAGQRIADYVYAGRQATILSSCLLVEGDLARRVRFAPTLSVNQDTDYLLRLERAGARFVCIDQPLYVQDVRPRGDRISRRSDLRRASLAWFREVGTYWSPAARRGYFLWDLSVRTASTGNRLLGLLYFCRGFSLDAGAYRVLRQLLRVAGGGEVPGFFKLFRRRWAPEAAI
jgi:glycosyltransferase involved in cell wall biosynthesis